MPSFDQVALGSATGTQIQGNFIGTNASGTAVLGPVNRRVSLYGDSTGNTIGGTTSGARNLISGAVAAFAHFSSMPGSTGAGLAEADREVVAEVGRRYDSNEHLSNAAEHTSVLTSEFVDRFAIVGPPDVCAERLRSLADLGIERFVITGASFRADREHVRTSTELLTGELLPALRERSNRV